MVRRHRDLYTNIANFSALKQAAKRAIRGKRKKPGAASFYARLEQELLRLEHQLKEQAYRPGDYTVIEIRDPKKRMVSAAPFRDRVVHHALCDVVQPIFEKSFIGNSFANRKGKGTHKAIRAYERYRDNYNFVLRCDIFRYFPAIDHEILKEEFRRRIACEKTLWLMDCIVDRSNRQEPVNLYYQGDDLFSPFERKRGLPIGNLTSQFFANLYLDRFDHFVTEVLQAPYVRYVDDFALFHDDENRLKEWKQAIEQYFHGRRLKLHPRKTVIKPTAEPETFLGFVLESKGVRRLPEDNVRRFRNRLRGMKDQLRSETVTNEEIDQRINSWVAHANHANSQRLQYSIFRGESVKPRPHKRSLNDPRIVGGRVLRGGSWNNKPQNLRSAYRNNNQPTNRNNNVGFRISSTQTARTGEIMVSPGEHFDVQGHS